MYSTGCISLAGSLTKTRGTPGFFGQLIKQPFPQLNREYHDPCEPLNLSWQWRAKDSPDVQRCSKLCLKKKLCPKKRFLPRFKKSFVYKDILACDPPKEKKKTTWSRYFDFLLPEEITSKPEMVTCRKMLEHRRRKCMDVEDYTKCIKGECWPLPTEWYGQGVLHVSELALSKPQPVTDMLKPCPPPAHMIAKCKVVKLPACPGESSCLDEVTRKMPYSQFKGADTDGSPPTITLRCPIKYIAEMLPCSASDKNYKLSCRTYGAFKSVECPKQMFNRYMNVDLDSKHLVPVPTTTPGYTPQREVKKGVCGRQTLLKPPSLRNFSTGRVFMVKDYPEFVRILNTQHLQPGKSPICFNKLVERAGMNPELLSKPPATTPLNGAQARSVFTEKELEQHEIEARKSEETKEDKQRKLDARKSKLQMLIDKQMNNSGPKKKDGETLKAIDSVRDHISKPFGGRLVDLEDVPYQRSSFHTSAQHLASKTSKKSDKKGSSSTTDDGDKICSGMPGIRALEESDCKPKVKRFCSSGKGVKGRCRVQRAIRPEDRVSPLSLKCKTGQDSPCLRQRSEPILIGVASKFLHTSSITFDKMNVPLKERIIIPTSSSEIVLSRNIKISSHQNNKDLFDQCCDQLDKLKKEVEALKNSQNKKAEQEKPKEKPTEKPKEQMNNDSECKQLLKRCCDQQEEMKKRMDSLQKAMEQKKNEETNKSAKPKDDPCEDNSKKEVKQSTPIKAEADPCKKPEKNDHNCRAVREKQQKAEDCAKFLTKQNEKLRKELEELKKQQSTNKKQVDKKGDECEEVEKAKKKAEDSVRSLIQENEKLKKELKALKTPKAEPKTGGQSKKAKPDVCAPKAKNIPKKAEKSEKEDDHTKQALDACVKKCSKKIQKDKIKKDISREKKKCQEAVKNKKRKLMDEQGGDEENAVARFLHATCCKLQEMAKKTKKKKPKSD